MNERIERLAAELEAIRTEIVELEAVEEPTEEQAQRAEELLTKWDEKKSEHEAAVTRAAKVDAVRQASIEGRVERYEVKAPQVMVRKDPVDDIDSVARGWVPGPEMQSRALTLIEGSRGVDDSAKESATRHVERNAGIARHALLVGSELYRSAFEKLLRYGPDMGLSMMDDGERYALRGTALSNTAGNGGYTIPFLLDPTVVLTNDGIAGTIRSISRVETGTSDKWNGVASSGVTAEWLAEATEAAEAGPTVTQPSITAYKGAAAITVSYEQEADGQLVSQLPRLIADAKSRLDEAAFATGDGSGKPKGVVTATTAVTASRVTPTTGGTFTTASIADVYKVANAIAPRHASNSSWLANKTTLNTIRQMDTYGGSSFWANLGMATPQQLLGQPVYENSTMTATVTTGSNLLLAGDFSEYLIYDRVGVEMRYNAIVTGTSAGRPTGQAAWFAFWRTGADVLNANAFRVLKL